jgi:hypothetical protein
VGYARHQPREPHEKARYKCQPVRYAANGHAPTRNRSGQNAEDRPVRDRAPKGGRSRQRHPIRWRVHSAERRGDMPRGPTVWPSVAAGR